MFDAVMTWAGYGSQVVDASSPCHPMHVRAGGAGDMSCTAATPALPCLACTAAVLCFALLLACLPHTDKARLLSSQANDASVVLTSALPPCAGPRPAAALHSLPAHVGCGAGGGQVGPPCKLRSLFSQLPATSTRAYCTLRTASLHPRSPCDARRRQPHVPAQQAAYTLRQACPG